MRAGSDDACGEPGIGVAVPGAGPRSPLVSHQGQPRGPGGGSGRARGCGGAPRRRHRAKRRHPARHLGVLDHLRVAGRVSARPRTGLHGSPDSDLRGGRAGRRDQLLPSHSRGRDREAGAPGAQIVNISAAQQIDPMSLATPLSVALQDALAEDVLVVAAPGITAAPATRSRPPSPACSRSAPTARRERRS